MDLKIIRDNLEILKREYNRLNEKLEEEYEKTMDGCTSNFENCNGDIMCYCGGGHDVYPIDMSVDFDWLETELSKLDDLVEIVQLRYPELEI